MKRAAGLLLIIGGVKLCYFILAWVYGHSPDLHILKRHDSYWYEKIAVYGHSVVTPDQLGFCEEDRIEQSYYAFFPLYPAIVGVTMKLIGATFNTTAFLYSLVFSISMFLLFFRFIREWTQSPDLAYNSTIVLVLFPFHFYFSMYYTEALYLLLLIGAFYFILKERMVAFSVVASLMVLTRPNGLFMLLPLFLFFTERHPEFNFPMILKLTAKRVLPLLYFLIPVLAFVGYCIYLKFMTGDFFAYKTAQAGWCRETVFPWEPILRSSNWMEYFHSSYLLLFVFFAVISVKRIPLSFSALIWISLILPLTANSITSARFISSIFVFSYLIASLLNNRSLKLKVIVFFSMFLAHLVSFLFWLEGSVFIY
jgi:Gpi18-like mannosyltransferase